MFVPLLKVYLQSSCNHYLHIDDNPFAYFIFSIRRVGRSLRTWEAFLAIAFRTASSLDMSRVCWYSVDTCFVGSRQSYSGCNTRAPCHRDVFCATILLCWEICRWRWHQRPVISYIKMILRMWGILDFAQKCHADDIEKVIFCQRKLARIDKFYKTGCIKTLPKLVGFSGAMRAQIRIIDELEP